MGHESIKKKFYGFLLKKQTIGNYKQPDSAVIKINCLCVVRLSNQVISKKKIICNVWHFDQMIKWTITVLQRNYSDNCYFTGSCLIRTR